jgi:hypothetical protein
MRKRPPVSQATMTKIAKALRLAIPNPEQDWFTRQELLDTLTRLGIGVKYRQLGLDLKLLKSIDCPYIDHLKGFTNLSRQSVECLIVFRWLVKQSNRHQACLSINYVMENLDYEQQFRPKSNITIEVTAQAV